MSELQPKRCRVCGHLDVFPSARCTSCGYLRAPRGLFELIEAEAPTSRDERKASRGSQEGAVPPPLPSPPSDRSESAPDSERSAARTEEAKQDDAQLLEGTFENVSRLFHKVQSFSALDDKSRAELYESLLLSMLKVEREHLRAALLASEGQRAQEGQRQRHLRHLALIGVLGWLVGIGFAFALMFLK